MPRSIHRNAGFLQPRNRATAYEKLIPLLVANIRDEVKSWRSIYMKCQDDIQWR